MADVPVFADTIPGKEAGYIYTISDKEGFISNEVPFYDKRFMSEPMTYDKLIETSLWIPAFSYGELKKMLAKLCEKNKKDCYKETDPRVKSRKMETLMKKKILEQIKEEEIIYEN